MTGEHDREQRNLTFSQREGKAPLPEIFEPGELTRRFRNRAWWIIDNDLQQNIEDSDEEWGRMEFASSAGGRFWVSFFYSYQTKIMELPHDELQISGYFQSSYFLRNLILEGEGDEVITALEHILRCPLLSKKLCKKLKECFDDTLYIVDESDSSVCIFPVASEEMKETVERSLANVNESGFTGARRHLRDAAVFMDSRDFPNSIRESIHAVESVARSIDPSASSTLGPALNSLERHGMLKHSALKEAFKKLYGYTSNEQGVRHALIEQDAADVGFDEAIFMYGTCVSFVDYLISKQKQIAQ